MTRWWIPILVALNLALLGLNLWRDGGWDADSRRDAQRLHEQLHPERMVLLLPASAASDPASEAPSPKP